MSERLYLLVIHPYAGEPYRVGEPMTKAMADDRFEIIGWFMNPGPLSWLAARTVQYASNPGYAELAVYPHFLPGDGIPAEGLREAVVKGEDRKKLVWSRAGDFLGKEPLILVVDEVYELTKRLSPSAGWKSFAAGRTTGRVED